MRRKHFRWHTGGMLDRPIVWMAILGVTFYLLQSLVRALS